MYWGDVTERDMKLQADKRLFAIQNDDVCLMESGAVRLAIMMGDTNTSFVPMSYVQTLTTVLGVSVNERPFCPVGSVEFVKSLAKRQHIQLPTAMSYPTCLLNEKFMARQIREGVMSEAGEDEFIKPRFRVQKFTGSINRLLYEYEGCPTNERVWISSPVSFVSEWRIYVIQGREAGRARYDANETDDQPLDEEFIRLAIDTMTCSGAPIGYALDVGLLDNGRTAVVEVNDGWALGYYKGTCSQEDYTDLLWKRWQEIVAEGNKKYCPLRGFECSRNKR